MKSTIDELILYNNSLQVHKENSMKIQLEMENLKKEKEEYNHILNQLKNDNEMNKKNNENQIKDILNKHLSDTEEIKNRYSKEIESINNKYKKFYNLYKNIQNQIENSPQRNYKKISFFENSKNEEDFQPVKQNDGNVVKNLSHSFIQEDQISPIKPLSSNNDSVGVLVESVQQQNFSLSILNSPAEKTSEETLVESSTPLYNTKKEENEKDSSQKNEKKIDSSTSISNPNNMNNSTENQKEDSESKEDIYSDDSETSINNNGNSGNINENLLFYQQLKISNNNKLSKARQQINHLEEQLTEALKMQKLLIEQNNLLKEEVREGSREKKREGVDLLYLKNIVIKYIETHDSKSMIPILSTLLQFSNEEVKHLEKINESRQTKFFPTSWF